jgi:hypothetical protein
VEITIVWRRFDLSPRLFQHRTYFDIL